MQRVVDYLKKLHPDAFLAVYHKLTEDSKYTTYEIYEMEQIDNILQGYYPSEIIALIEEGGGFSSEDNYFKFEDPNGLISLNEEDFPYEFTAKRLILKAMED